MLPKASETVAASAAILRLFQIALRTIVTSVAEATRVASVRTYNPMRWGACAMPAAGVRNRPVFARAFVHWHKAQLFPRTGVYVSPILTVTYPLLRGDRLERFPGR